MAYTMHIVNRESGDGFDVSTLAHDISYSTTLEGQPGKLTFTLEKDPNEILSITNGDVVKFWCDDAKVFYGYIFNIKTNRKQKYQVTAYDQMRYLQNHDYIFMQDMNLKTFFEKICNESKITKFKILGQASKLTDAEKLHDYFFNDVSYFDMFQYAITETNKHYIKEVDSMLSDEEGTKAYKFFLRDNFGTLELNDIENNLLFSDTGITGDKTEEWTGSENVSHEKSVGIAPLIIGDKSLLMDYEYELDVDKNTYNQIFLMDTIKSNSETKDKQTTNKVLSLAEQDNTAIKKWGLLRKIINLKTNYKDGTAENKKQIEQYIKLSLLEGAQPSRNLKLTALGYNGINAGDGFYLQLKKLNIGQMMYVISATHNYEGNKHTMELEVSTSRNLTEVL